eukprot:TRINITY_DN55754_c0_g1_i1.p1 TRINITY_DN55754_c0_g1~~TRINITY_DN55754_c0_g1_i1.p1  ORF type:complete len:524 (+),score=79.88 TRINITY_DN55754_c0_g1_i1:99-1670(+)
MDMFSIAPVESTSLGADELADASDDEDFSDDEHVELDAVPERVKSLRDIFVLPRFKRWLAKFPGNEARKTLLDELFRRLEVSTYVEHTVSSERVFSIEFCLADMEGRYSQRSHADPACVVLDADTLETLPNLKASLAFDGEELLGCTYFAGMPRTGKPVPKLDTEARFVDLSIPPLQAVALGPPATSRWADKQRLSDRFGSETLATLGGFSVLVHFLGVICADAAALADYSEMLPFGLSADIVVIPQQEMQDEDDAAAAENAARSTARSVKPGIAISGAAAVKVPTSASASVPAVGGTRSQTRTSSLGKIPATAVAARTASPSNRLSENSSPIHVGTCPVVQKEIAAPATVSSASTAAAVRTSTSSPSARSSGRLASVAKASSPKSLASTGALARTGSGSVSEKVPPRTSSPSARTSGSSPSGKACAPLEGGSSPKLRTSAKATSNPSAKDGSAAAVAKVSLGYGTPLPPTTPAKVAATAAPKPSQPVARTSSVGAMPTSVAAKARTSATTRTNPRASSHGRR